jgi:hypothetical protein
VAKVRAVTKTHRIETATMAVEAPPPSVEILGMAKPTAAGHAEMIDGDPETAVRHLFQILSARGLA